jgi:hypothetical protein
MASTKAKKLSKIQDMHIEIIGLVIIDIFNEMLSRIIKSSNE